MESLTTEREVVGSIYEADPILLKQLRNVVWLNLRVAQIKRGKNIALNWYLSAKYIDSQTVHFFIH